MNNELLDIFLLSLLSMFNPSLLAAVTVMLLLPSPKRLMAGYLLGAYVTSITVGLVIVFTLHGSSTESTSKHSISPVEDIVVGLLAVAIALVLGTRRDQPLRERRRDKKDAKLRAKQEAGKRTESLPLRIPRFLIGEDMHAVGRRFGAQRGAFLGNRPNRAVGRRLLPDAADPARPAALSERRPCCPSRSPAPWSGCCDAAPRSHRLRPCEPRAHRSRER